MTCIALHNFIRDSKLNNEFSNFICDSKLNDKELSKCDANKEYMPRASNTASQTQGANKVEGDNEATMNTIHNRIAAALASLRAS
jgi:hypothetical protein